MSTVGKKGRMHKLRNRLMGGGGSGSTGGGGRSQQASTESLFLDVPKQTRSASFDEMQLKNGTESKLLMVPDATSNKPRSKSFDSATSSSSYDGPSLLDVPRMRLRRRSSSDKNLNMCVHCIYLEELEKNDSPVLTPATTPTRDRVSWAQGALFHCRFDSSSGDSFQTESEDDDDEDKAIQREVEIASEILIPLPLVTLTSHFDSNNFYVSKNSASDPGITVVSLEVPEVWPANKQRSASVDGNFLKPVTSSSGQTDDGSSSSSSWLDATTAAKSQRSKSVDIMLPVQSDSNTATTFIKK